VIFSTLGNMLHSPFYRQSGVVTAITLKQKIDFKRGFTTLGTENSEELYLVPF
jgi:hypothetical protein